MYNRQPWRRWKTAPILRQRHLTRGRTPTASQRSASQRRTHKPWRHHMRGHGFAPSHTPRRTARRVWNLRRRVAFSRVNSRKSFNRGATKLGRPMKVWRPAYQHMVLKNHTVETIVATQQADLNGIESMTYTFGPNLNHTAPQEWLSFLTQFKKYKHARFVGITVVFKLLNPVGTQFKADGDAGDISFTDWETIKTDCYIARNDIIDNTDVVAGTQWYLRPGVKHFKNGQSCVNRIRTKKAHMDLNWRPVQSFFGGTQLPLIPPTINMNQAFTEQMATPGSVTEAHYPGAYHLGLTGMPDLTPRLDADSWYQTFTMKWDVKAYWHFQCKTFDTNTTT